MVYYNIATYIHFPSKQMLTASSHFTAETTNLCSSWEMSYSISHFHNLASDYDWLDERLQYTRADGVVEQLQCAQQRKSITASL